MQQRLKKGETYSGLMLGEDGGADYHLFILPGDAAGAPWEKQMAWAKSIGGDLPTRREQRVLFANAKKHFKPEWYWSKEQRADDSGNAWVQNFGSGYQHYDLKTFQGRARAVRRDYI